MLFDAFPKNLLIDIEKPFNSLGANITISIQVLQTCFDFGRSIVETELSAAESDALECHSYEC